MTMTLEELRIDIARITTPDVDVSWKERATAALGDAIKERDELREAAHYADGVASLAMKHRGEAESELDALKQRIVKGRIVRSTRNGVIRTPVGWCEPNTDYTIITEANPPTNSWSPSQEW